VVNTSYHGIIPRATRFFSKGVRVHPTRQHAGVHPDHFTDDVAFMKQIFGSNQGMDERKPQRGAKFCYTMAQTLMSISVAGACRSCTWGSSPRPREIFRLAAE